MHSTTELSDAALFVCLPYAVGEHEVTETLPSKYLYAILYVGATA